MLRLIFEGVRAKLSLARKLLVGLGKFLSLGSLKFGLWARRAGRLVERGGEFGPHGVRSLILYVGFHKPFVTQKNHESYCHCAGTPLFEKSGPKQEEAKQETFSVRV
jgi:hypothetical protein